MAAVDSTTQDEKALVEKEAEDKKIKEKFEAANNPEPPKSLPPESGEDDIEKPVPHKEWKFVADYDVMLGNEAVPQHFERLYIQKSLSYHAMIEFTGLLTRKLDEAMSGPEGLSLDKIMSDDEKLPLTFIDGQLAVVKPDSFDGIDSILKSVLKIGSYIPEFLTEAQCIWLRVPRNERPLLMDIWSKPVDEGGMSMRDGEEMLSLFIEQNYDELDYFLNNWWKNVSGSMTRAKKRKRK